jgi:hypothetical protein
LSAVPVVTFRSGGSLVTDGTVDYVETDAAQEIWTASYTVDASDRDGPVTFSVAFTDDAGNNGTAVTAVTNGSAVEIDNTAPTLTAVTLATTNATNNQHATDGDVVTLSFTSDDDLSADPVVIMFINGTAVVGGVSVNTGSVPNYTATFTVDGIGSTVGTDIDNQGGVTFTIDFTDDAGNTGTQVTSVTNSSAVEVDFTAPTLTSVSLLTDNDTDDQHATTGDVVTLSFTSDDDLSAVPVVTMFINGTAAVGGVTVNTGSAPNYTATFTVDGTGSTVGTDIDDQGSVTFSIDFVDDAGNNNGADVTAVTNTSSVEVDFTPPTLSNVTIVSNNGTNTDKAITADIVSLTFTIDDDITGTPVVSFRSGGANINNGVTVAVNGAHPDYKATYDVSSLDNDGLVTFAINFTDDAGNTGAQVTSVSGTGAATSVTIDNTAPTVTITRNAVTNGSFTGTNDTSLSYDITFSEDIDNDASEFTIADDITINSTGLTLTSGLTEDIATSDFTLTFSSITGDGDLSFDISNSGGTPVTDLAGNVLSATVVSNVITIDNTNPIATITRNSVTNGSFTGTNDGSISFDISFSTAIDNGTFVVGDVTITNPGTIILGTAVLTADGDNQNYTFTLPITSGDGDLSITLDAGVIADAATNGLNPAVTSNTITIDNTAPTLDALSITSTNATDDKHARATEVVTLTMNFDDDLTSAPSVSFRSGSVPVQGTVTYTEISDFVADGDEEWIAAYTVDSLDFDGDVDFTLTYTDDAGNVGSTLDKDDLDGGAVNTVEIDKILPTVTFTDSQVRPSNTSPVVITATFDEDVTDLDDTEFTITNGVISSLTGSGSVYTINITPDNPLDANISISLNASAVIDDAGNTNVVSSVYNVDYDNTPPVITASAIVQGREVSLKAKLDEPGTIYYVVVADGVSVTDADDVVSVSGAAASAVASGSITFTTGGINIIETMTLDADRTNYELYLVSEDNVDSKNLLATPEQIAIQSGGVTINTPSLVDICLEGDFFEIPAIVLTETIATDFNSSASNRTIILELPSNFIFNKTAGTVTDNGGDVDIDASGLGLKYNSSATTLTITYKASAEALIDELTISALQVQASGSVVSFDSLFRSGGNGDIYGINDEDAAIPRFAEFTTIAPFDAPTIVTSVPITVTNPYIIETDSVVLGDYLGDGVTVYRKDSVQSQGVENLRPMTIGTVNASDNVKIYSNENLANLVLDLSGSLTYSPSLADLGFTDANVDANVGVNTFWITVTDGKGCESAATKYGVAIIRLANSAATTTFSDSDQTGTIFKFTRPAGSSAVIVGDGLTSANINDTFSSPTEGAFSVKYLPITAGAGRDTIKYSLTNASGQTANYWVSLLVNSTDRVFESPTVGDQGLCADIDTYDFNVRYVNDVDFDGVETGSNPDFYNLSVFLFENGSRTTDITSEAISGNPDIIIGEPTSASGWQLDLGTIQTNYMGATQNSLQLDVVMYLRDENTDTPGELSSEVITIFRNPIVTFRNLTDGSYYCEDDEGFDVEVQIISAAGTVTRDIDDNGYMLLYKANESDIDYDTILVSDTVSLPGFYAARLNFQDLNANGDSTENETGFYKIVYTSANYTLASCASTIESTFRLLAKPDRKLLNLVDNKIVGKGELDAGTNTYTFEYCEGETFNALEVSLDANQKILWYRNAELTNSISTGDMTGANITLQELFNTGTVAQGTENVSFYYVFVDNTNLGGGCASEAIEVNYKAYRIPDEPVVDTDNVNIFSAGPNNYEMNYCVDAESSETADLDDISLDLLDSLENPLTTDYYIIRFADGTKDTIRKQTFNPSEFAQISQGVAGTSNTFYLRRVENDNTVYGTVAAEFAGCASSDSTQITINVFDSPSNPAITEFTDSPTLNSNIVTYYMCQGDDLPDISINPSNEIADNEYLYEWYSDEAGTTPIAIKDRQGDLVVENDLNTAALYSIDTNRKFSRDSAGTYSMWVQVSSNIRNDASFVGCPSGTTQVDLVVFPEVEKPAVTPIPTDDLTITTETLPGGEEIQVFTFCVEVGGANNGLLGTNIFDTEIILDGNNEVSWYLANETSTGLLSNNAITTGSSTTAADLLIANQPTGTTNFAVIHTDNIIGDNGVNFSGCDAEITFFKVVVGTIPDTQFAFDGIVEDRPTTFKFYDGNSTPVRNNGVKILIQNLANDTLRYDSVASIDMDYPYTFADPGDYQATVTLETEIGCSYAVTRRFRILENIPVASSYTESFDSGNGGWFAEFQSLNGQEGSIDNFALLNSWEYGLPGGTLIQPESAVTSDSAWVTNLTGSYNTGEESFVYSPSFNLDALANPVISFKTIRNLDNKDGVVFQYSLDNGINWVNIGNFENDQSSGVEWFNAKGISATPGNRGVNTTGATGFNTPTIGRYGWSDSDVVPQWVESIHSLVFPENSDVTNVRFRFALGANNDEKSVEGFGFDDMRIFDLEKTVLVEQFSSTLNTNSPAVLGAIPGHISYDNVMFINYFTDFSNGSTNDILNRRNVADPGARAEYYEVSSDPNSVLDGDVFEPSNSLNWNASDINLKSLRPVLFRIQDEGGENSGITYSVGDNVISATARFEYDDSDEAVEQNMNLSFHIAIVERKIPVSDIVNDNPITELGSFDNIDTLYNVLRVMSPSAAGNSYSGLVQPGQEFEYSMSWPVTNMYNVNINGNPNVRMIAFVQNNIDNPISSNDGLVLKEVLQSAYVDIIGLTDNVLGVEPLSNFSIYPNPGDKEITVEFDKVISKETDWVMYDQTGREVLKGSLDAGTVALRVETKDIPSGIYLFHLYGDGKENYAKRVIIVH